MTGRGFTIIELIISVALLIGAISIALFATIGSSGLIQRADSRATVTESGRAVSDTFKRTVGNASMSSVFLTDATGANRPINTAVWVKAFSGEQAASICHVIGRASKHPVLKNRYNLDNNGTLVAYWISLMDANQNCVTAPNLSGQALYQNRLTSGATYVVDFAAALTYLDPARQIYPLLRYRLDIGLTDRQGELIETGQTTPIVLSSAVPIGLINRAIAPLTIDTVALPDGSCGVSYSGQLQATGGLPNYSWQATSGVPSGLVIASNGAVSGTVNCTMTTDYQITVRVTDSQATSVSRTVALRMISPQGELRILTTSPLPQTNKLVASYSHTFSAQGASSFSWSIQGDLPPTSSIDPSTGVFSFSPSAPTVAARTYNFQVTVTDATNSTRSFTASFSLTVADGGGGAGGPGAGGVLLP